MAEAWAVSPDGLTYRFLIRKTAKWSNGDAVTAHDFEASWRRVLEPKTAAQYAYQLYAVKNAKAFNTWTKESGKPEVAWDTVGIKAVDGQTFEVEFERPLEKGRMQVRSWFNSVDGDAMQIDYALHRRNDEWQIIDVYYSGVSGTRIQRNEFTEIIQNDGMDGLLEKLTAKVESMENNAN